MVLQQQALEKKDQRNIALLFAYDHHHPYREDPIQT
jgi:hypothetical protein